MTIDPDTIFPIVLLLGAIVGIITRPAIFLVILGVLAVLGGLFTLATGNVFGISFGVTGIVSGVALVAFGRLVAFVEALLNETRLLRSDISARMSAPVEVMDPLEAEMRREVRAAPARQPKRKRSGWFR